MINYFKPHIVEFHSGKFAVRRRKSLFAFQYYDAKEPFSFARWEERHLKWCYVDTLEEAEKLLAVIHPKVKKVYEN